MWTRGAAAVALRSAAGPCACGGAWAGVPRVAMPRCARGCRGGRPSNLEAVQQMQEVQHRLLRNSNREDVEISLPSSYQARALGVAVAHTAAWAVAGGALAKAWLLLPVGSNFLAFTSQHPEWALHWVGAHSVYFGMLGLRRGLIHGAESILLRSDWVEQVVAGIGEIKGFSVRSVHEWVAFRVVFEEKLDGWTEAVRKQGGIAAYFPPVSVTIERIQTRLGDRLRRGQPVPVADAFHLALKDLMRERMEGARTWETVLMGGGYLMVLGFLVSVQNFFAS